MKGLVDRPRGEVETGWGRETGRERRGTEREKAGNRTKTKSQLPTNSIREVWTSRSWNVLGSAPERTASRPKNKNASESWRKEEESGSRAT